MRIVGESHRIRPLAVPDSGSKDHWTTSSNDFISGLDSPRFCLSRVGAEECWLFHSGTAGIVQTRI